ncbi:hypothetical protein [Fervidibacillus albus]|uniref:Uncharacterized protein n=1 Tax=Fervidibacillus albus TaxID=2980026 RepID=A0A9E8LW67_9BACI|nr:hypothetical protein [Fervidibacillus albus]WAA10828.1 hypothetical protein OE104_05815 [Fervidibacillus albus]
METITHIITCFSNSSNFDIKEDFKEVDVSIDLDKNFNIPKVEDFQAAINKIIDRDQIVIDFIFDESDPITYHRKKDVKNFLDDIESYRSIVVDNPKMKIKIYKNIDENSELSIYSFGSFIEQLLNLTLTGVLYKFREILNSRPQLRFKLIDVSNEIDFGTSTFIFTSNHKPSISLQPINRQEIIESRNKLVNYYNAIEYNFIPDDFFLIKKSNYENINNFFEKLANIFSLIYITDFSNIKNDNELYFRMNGYKLIEETISFKELKYDNDVLYKIYKWIYSGGNLSDKLGLAKNVITLQSKIENKNLVLSENVMNSIMSSYEIYLKENVSQYIEVKNKVSEFLIDLTQKISDLVNSFGNALKNNSFLFLSYFLSVIVFNTISTGKLTNIFTKDITYISYGLLVISIVYLFASVIQSRMEEKRFITQYNRTKKMYEDILDKEDINSIFKMEDHKEDLNFIHKRIFLYTTVWILEIIILFVIVYVLKL